MAPSGKWSKESPAMTPGLPVAVKNTSPILNASSSVVTRIPSSTASSARIGSSSTTVTWPPSRRRQRAILRRAALPVSGLRRSLSPRCWRGHGRDLDGQDRLRRGRLRYPGEDEGHVTIPAVCALDAWYYHPPAVHKQ